MSRKLKKDAIRKHPVRLRIAIPRGQKIPRNRRELEASIDAFHILSIAQRRKLSLLKAVTFAAEHGTPVLPATVLKWTDPAWKKRGRDHRALPSDRLIRFLQVPRADGKGMKLFVVRSKHAATMISQYYMATKKALSGKPSALRAFRGKRMPGSREKFYANLPGLRRLEAAGLLPRDIYWHKQVLL